MEEYELRSLLDELESVKGRGTWHISLYCRPDRSINQAANEIRSEYAEAENIKSDDTRKKVQDSLGKMKSALASFDEMPDTGLVLFSSPADIHILDNLPITIKQNLYHCGKSFITDELRSQLKRGGEYGLVVVERGGAVIGTLSGETITEVSQKDSQVMGKTKAGGFSQARFERERERQKEEFLNDVAGDLKAMNHREEWDGVIVGGSNHTAREFIENDYLSYEVQDKVIGPFGVEYANKQGLEQLVDKASNQIAEEETKDARQVVERFFKALRSGKAEYGLTKIHEALEYSAVDTLILTTKLGQDEISTFTEMAKNHGSNVIVIEPSFEKAEMFQRMTGGAGALLRYEI